MGLGQSGKIGSALRRRVEAFARIEKPNRHFAPIVFELDVNIATV